jgi:sulfonate transport system ATP-binding protein
MSGVRIAGLTRRFGENTVLDRLNLDIAPGEFVALLGRSGSGKSTLLRTLAGLDPVEQGEVDVPSRRAVVFQDPRLLPWKRVWRNVALGLDDADPKARALVRSPELLLLDEPFAALDALTRLRMQELVSQLWATHQPAVLLVTHDVDEAVLLADRALVLEHGRIAVETRIDLPRPRRSGTAGFSAIRTMLLEALGVHEPAAAHDLRDAA